MIRSNLRDYNDSYIRPKGTAAFPNTAGATINNTNRIVIFKNWALFIDCITEIDNARSKNWCVNAYV